LPDRRPLRFAGTSRLALPPIKLTADLFGLSARGPRTICQTKWLQLNLWIDYISLSLATQNSPIHEFFSVYFLDWTLSYLTCLYGP